MGKIIAVVNQKGGVGKTTTAINLAAGVALQGKRTLLVDADPQGNTTSGLGIAREQRKQSTYDVLIGNASAEQVVLATQYANLFVLPSNIDLAAAELELAPMDNREARLKAQLARLRDAFDVIMIDCPPSLGLITLNALCAADTFLIPVQCEFYALEGMSQLMATVRTIKRLYNPSIELEGVLFTMYDGRLNLTQQVVAEVKKYFPNKVFATVIPRAVRLSEAPSYGQPIQVYDRTGKGAEAYNQAARELILRINSINR